MGNRTQRLAGVLATLLLLTLGAAQAEGKTPRFQRGMTVVEWGPTAYEPVATKRLLTKLRRQGVDTVTIPIVWNQRSPDAVSVGPGRQTAPTARVVRAIRTARRLGLRVVFRPYVDVDDGSWRGFLEPSSRSRWFGSYGSFILKFAKVAERERVHMFVVGSEMRSLSGDADRWKSLVSRVRRRYHGIVSYQANWDEFEQVTWWKAVDVISLSAYFPLRQSDSWGLADLVAGWREPWSGPVSIFDRIDRVRRQYGRSVIFGEIGYVPAAATAIRPWDSGFGSSDPESQRIAYEAAFKVWWPVSWFKGFNWWYVNPTLSLVEGTNGFTHQPRPPALGVLRRYYRSRR